MMVQEGLSIIIFIQSNSTSDFNLIRNYDYNLNVVIQGNSVAQESMDGVDGRVRIATSNSYMMTPGSTITIPVNIKGNSNKLILLHLQIQAMQLLQLIVVPMEREPYCGPGIFG
ncbi:MAG: hypothetical protein H6Q12_1346 [Bacteroidetes bacterium]|nr:hypothetical protein [Bacteroidota bacterium]